MAKVTIQAGAQFDTCTRDEVRHEIEAARTNWVREVSRGIKAQRRSIFGDSDGSGVITIGKTGDQQLGPAAGFAWLVTRLSVSGGYDPTTQALALYHSSNENSALIDPDLSGRNILTEVLYAGETLVLAGTVTASTRLWVTVQVWEAPEALAWKLL